MILETAQILRIKMQLNQLHSQNELIEVTTVKIWTVFSIHLRTLAKKICFRFY